MYCNFIIPTNSNPLLVYDDKNAVDFNYLCYVYFCRTPNPAGKHIFSNLTLLFVFFSGIQFYIWTKSEYQDKITDPIVHNLV